jgi:hypothetical protein
MSRRLGSGALRPSGQVVGGTRRRWSANTMTRRWLTSLEPTTPSTTKVPCSDQCSSTLAGCVGGRPGPPNPAGPSTATTHSSGPVTLADAKHCPVTRPGRVGPKEVSADRGPAGRDRPARLRALGGPDGPVRAAQLPVLQGLLPAVRVPVHIVSGAHDELVPPSNGRYLAERLPDSRLSILNMVTSPASRSRPVRHHRRRMGGPRRGTIHPPLVERNTLQAPIEQPAAATGDRQRGRSPDDQSLPGLIVWEVQAREARPR